DFDWRAVLGEQLRPVRQMPRCAEQYSAKRQLQVSQHAYAERWRRLLNLPRSARILVADADQLRPEHCVAEQRRATLLPADRTRTRHMQSGLPRAGSQERGVLELQTGQVQLRLDRNPKRKVKYGDHIEVTQVYWKVPSRKNNLSNEFVCSWTTAPNACLPAEHGRDKHNSWV